MVIGSAVPLALTRNALLTALASIALGWTTAGATAIARVAVEQAEVLPGEQIVAHVLVDLTESPGVLLGAYEARLSWNPEVLQLTDVGDGDTPAYYGPQTSLASGHVTFTHFSVAGARDEISLLTARFQVLGAPGDSTALDLTFSTADAAGTFQSILPDLEIQPAALRVVTDELPSVIGRMRLSASRPVVATRLEVEIVVELDDDEEQRLGAYEARLTWDPAVLELAAIEDGDTPAFASPTVITGSDELLLSHFNVFGAVGDVSLLRAGFDVIGEVGDRGRLAVFFSVLDASHTFTDLLPRLELRPVSITVMPVPSLPTSDFNGDRVVDLIDFFLFAEAFGTGNAAFDLDGNGEVALFDFFLFGDAFGLPVSGAN